MALELDKEWRKKEESLSEVIKKYPTLPAINIIELDLHRRGVRYTEKALEKVDINIHQVSKKEDKDNNVRYIPESLTLRDGSNVIVSEDSTVTNRDPYTIDVVDNKIVIVDNDEVIEEVEYWEKPEFYDKVTSRGTKMSDVIKARPQRYSINVSKYCHFWTRPGEGCKYCGIGASGFKYKGCENERVNLDDLRETMVELVKEKGRFTGVILTGGSILSGNKLCDDELEAYIEALQTIGSVVKTRRFPSQVNSTALDEEQLTRLYNETGLSSYTTDLEAFQEHIYQWVCPGKAAHIPYSEWKNRLFNAVKIFGKGYVDTGLVSGVELAKPYGYTSEAEAIKADLEQAEELTQHGVGLKHDIWHVVPGSIFHNQTTPSLDYYAQITKGFYDLNYKYGISLDMDSYRKCGMHPNINLDRI